MFFCVQYVGFYQRFYCLLYTSTDHLACSIIVHVMCAEHRFLVVGTERVESFQFIEELRRDIFKIYFGIDIDPVSYTHLDVYKRQTYRGSVNGR